MWLWTYNNEQPRMAVGGITLKQKPEIATKGFYLKYHCCPVNFHNNAI